MERIMYPGTTMVSQVTTGKGKPSKLARAGKVYSEGKTLFTLEDRISEIAAPGDEVIERDVAFQGTEVPLGKVSPHTLHTIHKVIQTKNTGV